MEVSLAPIALEGLANRNENDGRVLSSAITATADHRWTFLSCARMRGRQWRGAATTAVDLLLLLGCGAALAVGASAQQPAPGEALWPEPPQGPLSAGLIPNIFPDQFVRLLLRNSSFFKHSVCGPQVPKNVATYPQLGNNQLAKVLSLGALLGQ